MIRAARPGDADQEIEQRVRVRMARQALLIQDDPIDLRVVLDEAVLSRPVGGDAVMRDQLAKLIETARLPNVSLQILPFAAGAHAGMDGSFVILEFEEEGDADVVFIDNATGACRHDEDAVREQCGFLDVVCHEEHRLVLLLVNALQLHVESLARHGVECTEWLVHEQDRRVMQEGARDGDPLLHAARQLARIFGRRVGKVRRGR